VFEDECFCESVTEEIMISVTSSQRKADINEMKHEDTDTVESETSVLIYV
jgi:hypothetical protein